MELDHAVIRMLAAIEREQDYPEEAKKWQTFVEDIRTSFWEEADDIAGRLLSLRLVGVLPAGRQDGEGRRASSPARYLNKGKV